jgi:hypothetical protein
MFRTALFTLLLCAMSLAAIAQTQYRIRYVIPYDRMSEGQQYRAQKSFYALSVPSFGLHCEHSLDVNTAGNPTFKRSKRNGFGIGAMIFGNFIKLGEFNYGTSILALEYVLSINSCSYKFDKLDYVGLDKGYKGNFTTYALPLTLMYKRGAEADLSQERKTMYSIGIGIAPSIANIDLLGASGRKIPAMPFAMAEYGVFAGRAIKLRATYFPLEKDMFDGSHKLQNGNMLRSKLSVSSGLVISLILMQFSHHWGG